MADDTTPPETSETGTLIATVTGEITPVTPAVEAMKAAAASHKEGEESLLTSGQRRINLIWEVTQSVIAMTVTTSTLYVSANLALNNQGDTSAFLLLSNVFFLVIGTYFNRSNHQRIGGVQKDDVGR